MPFKIEIVKTEKEKKREELWRFYEKAIEGRNAFYGHYVKYMNLYAIFTGAFFVAFYHVFDKDSFEKLLLAIIIAMLGLGSSILWLGSVKGYYAWIINWIKVVQHYEDLLNENNPVKESCFVYRLFYNIEKEPKARECFFLRPSRYSTQKLTMLFVEMIIVGWVSALLMSLYDLLRVDDAKAFFISVVAVLLIFLFFCISNYFKDPLKDNIRSHYKLVLVSKNGDEIVRPEFTIENKGGDE
ncbi:MAG: hypothetical protein J6W22_03915 [Fibrobacter sp.]|nr:hypothetical protein [Fibrobacter sp.]